MDADKSIKKDSIKEKQSAYVTVRLAFIALTCVFIVTLIGFLFLLDRTHTLAETAKDLSIKTAVNQKINRRLIILNAKRDQKDRVTYVSICRKNIEGVRLIFKPFFPSPPATLQQRKTINKFNDRVNTLKNRCKKQLDVK